MNPKITLESVEVLSVSQNPYKERIYSSVVLRLGGKLFQLDCTNEIYASLQENVDKKVDLSVNITTFASDLKPRFVVAEVL
jgi:hypothetical protein